MNKREILDCRRLPAILTAEEALSLLGFTSFFHLRILMSAGLLRPLGKPSPNGQKLFSSAEVLALAADRDWADRAVKVISKAIQEKNRKAGTKFHERVDQQAKSNRMNLPPFPTASSTLRKHTS